MGPYTTMIKVEITLLVLLVVGLILYGLICLAVVIFRPKEPSYGE